MSADGDRTRFWPAIEKKHGGPMEHWFDQVRAVASGKYEDQVACLREGAGFSRTHANAVVMYVRGSSTSKRFATVDDYLADADPAAATTVRAIFRALHAACPGGEVVIAWNQPMFRVDGEYVLGVSLAKAHILIAPWGRGVLAQFAPRLETAGYVVNRKTVRVPVNWDVDAGLLADMAAARLGQLRRE